MLESGEENGVRTLFLNAGFRGKVERSILEETFMDFLVHLAGGKVALFVYLDFILFNFVG